MPCETLPGLLEQSQKRSVSAVFKALSLGEKWAAGYLRLRVLLQGGALLEHGLRRFRLSGGSLRPSRGARQESRRGEVL